MSGRFALLNKEWQRTEREIMELIKQFCYGIEQIKDRYPDAGIGDTETDELIVDEIYNQIH